MQILFISHLISYSIPSPLSQMPPVYSVRQIDDFYVEAKLGLQTKALRTFKTGDLLQPYLDAMVIPKLT
jgi:hypothetical protein